VTRGGAKKGGTVNQEGENNLERDSLSVGKRKRK